MRKPTGGDRPSRAPRRAGVAGLYAVPKQAENGKDPSRPWVLDARTVRVLSTISLGALVAAFCKLIEAWADGDDPPGEPDANQVPLPNSFACDSDPDDVISIDE